MNNVELLKQEASCVGDVEHQYNCSHLQAVLEGRETSREDRQAEI